MYPNTTSGIQQILCKGRNILPNTTQTDFAVCYQANYGIRTNGTELEFFYTPTNSLDSSQLYNGTAYTNYTALSNSVTSQGAYASDTQFNLTNSTSGYSYFGCANQFVELFFDIQTNGTYVTPLWQYSTGNNTWATLTVTDATANFGHSGLVNWTIPVTWGTDTVNSAGPYYWVRVGFGTVTTPAKATRISRILKFATSGAGQIATTWYHILVTGMFGLASTWQWWINGVQNMGANWVKGYGDGSQTTLPNKCDLMFGTDTNWDASSSLGQTKTRMFNGYLDNTIIYNRVMNTGEPKQHFQGVYNTGGWVLNLQFEEGLGNTTSDTVNVVQLQNATFYALTPVPNTQNTYGKFVQFYDRLWTGAAEATTFGQATLNQLAVPARYVQGWIPMDLRYTTGQTVNVLDKTFRGRAILNSIRHVFDDNPRSEITLLYYNV